MDRCKRRPATAFILVAALALPAGLTWGEKPPNVLFLLTDDQDITLGSLSVMPKLKSLVTDAGAQFENAFVNTPICCPSRAEIQTGRYMHNTGVSGNDCGGDVSVALLHLVLRWWGHVRSVLAP